MVQEPLSCYPVDIFKKNKKVIAGA